MKLYNSIGPNPRAVRIFMAEKGIALPTETVDIRGGDNRKPAFLAKNPMGQCPALELDDGTIISEITAICEYLDETHPGGTLIGATPEQRAETRMWTRRLDLGLLEPMANGYRFSTGLKMFQSRIRCIPQAADDLKATARERLAWLDGIMADGRPYIAGSRLSLADIVVFAFVDFFHGVDQPLDPALTHVAAWHARMKARPSASA